NDPGHVLRRRRPGGGGRADPGHVLQHRPVVDGLSGRIARLHRGRAGRHRQHERCRARRSADRIPVRVERPVHLRPLDQRDRVLDPHRGPRVPSPRPHGRGERGQGMSALGRTVLVASLLLYPFVDRALGWQTVHAVSDGMIYVLLALGLNLGVVTVEIGTWRPIERLNLTGGENGVNPVGRPYLPGVPFETDPVPWYFLILVIGALSVWAMSRLRDSRLGRAWMAIREDETAADCTGVNPVSTKLL